jgi:hypothetical protein
MPPQRDDSLPQVSLRPSPFDLGVTYQGAALEGSFHVLPAGEIRRVDFSDPAGREVLELSPPAQSRQGGLLCPFRVRADEPGTFFTFLKLETDTGSACTHFSLGVRPGPPPGGRVLFCQSPFHAFSDPATHRNLGLMVRELGAQLNVMGQLPEDLSPYRVLVLHGLGLRSLVEDAGRHLHRHIEAGRRVVVLADHFYRDTVMLANHLAEPYGLRLEDREYGEVLCDRRHLAAHPLTAGVERLHWFRPTPVLAEGRGQLLVRNPDRPTEGFVACAGPRDNLVVVGVSLLSSLLCNGWPFHNGQLLANLLGHRGR